MKEDSARTETRDGQEFTVVTLPPDKRLQPARTRERHLFQRLSAAEKNKFIRSRINKARRKRKRKGKR